VLEEIKAAVEERVPPYNVSHTGRKSNHISTWLRKLRNAKRMYKDQEELTNLRQKLQNAVDRFTVRIAHTHSTRTICEDSLIHVQASSLLRNELSSLKAASDSNAVRDLANRIWERQEQQNARREVEARGIMALQMQHDMKREAEAGELPTFCQARLNR
jgi:hypothetical protein